METPEDLYAENFIESDVEVIEDANDNPEMQLVDGEHENEGGTENENDGDTASKPVKPKRVIRNPQPKLNAETLKGKRGLTAVESYFDRVKFKGRGYEEQDLSVILKTYEYWCHRLFPKYTFEECIDKIEKLGRKKPVITHIKKIRLDMIVDDQPIVPNDNNDLVTDDIGNLDNPFDELPDDVPRGPVELSSDVSEEQLERIRINKERAEQKRRERLREKMESSLVSQEIELQNLESSLTGENQNDNFTQSSELLSTPSISEEQIMEQIRINKEKAEQRRRERLKEKMGLVTSQQLESPTLMQSNLENEVYTDSSERTELQASSELNPSHIDENRMVTCDYTDNVTQADYTEVATSSNSQSETASQEIQASSQSSPSKIVENGNVTCNNTDFTQADYTEVAMSSNPHQPETASQEIQLSSELSPSHVENGSVTCDNTNVTQADYTELAMSSNAQSETASLEIMASSELSPSHIVENGSVTCDNTDFTQADYTETTTTSYFQSETAPQEHSSENNMEPTELHGPVHNQK